MRIGHVQSGTWTPSPVNLPAMADGDNNYSRKPVIDFVYRPVVSDPNSPGNFSRQLFAAGGTRLLLEPRECIQHSLRDPARQAVQLLLHGFWEDDLIRHFRFRERLPR